MIRFSRSFLALSLLSLTAGTMSSAMDKKIAQPLSTISASQGQMPETPALSSIEKMARSLVLNSNNSFNKTALTMGILSGLCSLYTKSSTPLAVGVSSLAPLWLLAFAISELRD